MSRGPGQEFNDDGVLAVREVRIQYALSGMLNTHFEVASQLVAVTMATCLSGNLLSLTEHGRTI